MPPSVALCYCNRYANVEFNYISFKINCIYFLKKNKLRFFPYIFVFYSNKNVVPE